MAYLFLVGGEKKLYAAGMVKMNGRLGTYIMQKKAQESFKAYVPPRLPLDPPLEMSSLSPVLEKATHALGELNGIAETIPNISLFIYMYVRKEALLSSQIEGTQSSFSDLILFEHSQKPTVSLEDVEEVSNYVKALHYGLQRMGELPLSLRLLREIHGILLSGGRGSQKLPGEFRRTQNWIGGTRPGNALFVPPPVEQLMECLANFEKFLHDTSLPVLIKAGIVHVQFESIHPFLDGNGRLGRLLVILLLCSEGVLSAPILYISLYLKQNRETYYNLLQEVRREGTWETWLEFFLEGVFQVSKQAIHIAKEINQLFAEDKIKIEALGRIRFSCLETFEHLKKCPQISVAQLSQELDFSVPTARSALNHMAQLGILQEISGKKRDKIYIYKKYLDILEEGAEPFSR